jgi:hypothetical protein
VNELAIQNRRRGGLRMAKKAKAAKKKAAKKK